MCLTFTEAPKYTRLEPKEALPPQHHPSKTRPLALLVPGKERRALVEGHVGPEAAAVLGP